MLDRHDFYQKVTTSGSESDGRNAETDIDDYHEIIMMKLDTK